MVNMKSKKELLKSPVRPYDYDTQKEYDRILLVPSGKLHESGYMRIAIIGVTGVGKKEEYEICAYPDDISCYFPIHDLGNNTPWALVRMDCYYPSGVLQYHGRGTFKVGTALSSVDIEFIPYKK